ncbi:MAG: glycosyltransferase family 2 protein [Patescibacteria group bacterium]|nr:glycosyltransferase family 2 protein [Patescibacteria group bacterium]
MKVFVVIPAFNEEGEIAGVVREVLPLIDKIVVVDDCSKDKTKEVASEAGAVVLRHSVNRGQGAALRLGTRWSLQNGADIIVHFDADGQFRPIDIPRVTAPLIAGEADVVFGSRFLDNTTQMPSFKKKVIMPLARFVNFFFLRVKLTDPQSGFRAFTKEVGLKLHWRQDRMAHCSEILSLVAKGGWRIKEVPITVIYKDFGQSIFGGFKIIKDLFIKKLTK